MATTQNGLANQSAQTTQESLVFGLRSRQDLWLFFIKLLVAIVVVGLMIIVSKFVARFVSRRVQETSIADDEYTKKVSMLISNIIYYTLMVFAILIGFKIIGLDFSLIVGGISFGVGFAFKEIFGNMIAGILVLTNKEFKLGDIVQVDDKEHYFGRIEEITIRYTVIRTFDLRKVVVPNLTLITKPIRTFDSEDLVRLELTLTMHYETPMPRGLEIIKKAVNSVPFVKAPESTRAVLQKMGDHGLEVLVYFYFDPASGRLIQTAKGDVQEAIFDAFKEEGIVIPYPHSTLTVDHNDKNLIGSALYVAKESAKYTDTDRGGETSSDKQRSSSKQIPQDKRSHNPASDKPDSTVQGKKTEQTRRPVHPDKHSPATSKQQAENSKKNGNDATNSSEKEQEADKNQHQDDNK